MADGDNHYQSSLFYYQARIIFILLNLPPIDVKLICINDV